MAIGGVGDRDNPVTKKIKEITQKQINEVIKPQKGTVYHYNNEHNYAMVEIDNPFGGGLYLLEYVPVQIAGGMHVPGPFPGDEVWVEFTGGRLELPKVVSLADRQYETNFREKRLKHKRKGAYIPERLSKQIIPDWYNPELKGKGR